MGNLKTQEATEMPQASGRRGMKYNFEIILCGASDMMQGHRLDN